VGDLEGVYLYNLDDIEKIIEGNIRNREAEALKAEVIIKEQV